MRKKLFETGAIVISILLYFWIFHQKILSSDTAVWQSKVVLNVKIINDSLLVKMNEIQNKIAEIEEAVKKTKNSQQIIEQLNIQGETEEETTLLNEIIIMSWDEISDFLCYHPSEQKGVSIFQIDLTGDGIKEIIVSKEFIDISDIFTYQYIFDREGNKLLEFAWGRDLEIYTKESEEGLFYIRGYIHIAAHNDLWLYGEIRHKEGEWEEKLSYIEWDTRFGLERDNNVKEGYGIYTGFEEDGNDLFKGAGGIMELTREKEQVDADMLKEYLNGQKKTERDAESIGTILYFEESDEFVWWNHFARGIIIYRDEVIG